MASFLDNTKNFGLMIAIIGLVDLIVSVLMLIEDMNNLNLMYIGGIIVGLIYLFAGIMVYTQKPGALAPIFPEGISSKFGVLTGYIFLVGVTGIIDGIFVAAFSNADGNLMAGIGTIVLAIIIIAVGWIITNDTKNVLDKVIYYILIIIFALSVILGLIGIFGLGDYYHDMYLILAIVESIAAIVMYLMAFLYLLSAEVKTKF